MLPDSRSAPAGVGRRPLANRCPGLAAEMALSKAPVGPSSTPPVICPAIGHLAQHCGFERQRNLEVDVFDRGENGHIRFCHAECVGRLIAF